jgi:hypothetical protein
MQHMTVGDTILGEVIYYYPEQFKDLRSILEYNRSRS